MAIDPAGRPPGILTAACLFGLHSQGHDAPLPRTRVPDRVAAHAASGLCRAAATAPARPPAASHALHSRYLLYPTPRAMRRQPDPAHSRALTSTPGMRRLPTSAASHGLGQRLEVVPAAADRVTGHPEQCEDHAGHDGNNADRPENRYSRDEPDNEENDAENDQGGLLVSRVGDSSVVGSQGCEDLVGGLGPGGNSFGPAVPGVDSLADAGFKFGDAGRSDAFSCWSARRTGVPTG
jgi:hypothetical protein